MNPTEQILPKVYRGILKISRRRGLLTLGRLNHRLFQSGQYFQLPTGNRFFLPPDPHFFGYMAGHESHIARLISEIVRPGDVCLDVGANIGYFALQLAARSGPDGLTVAYEPDSGNFAMLTTNADLARSEGLQIECVASAVSDSAGSCRLIHGGESTLHTVSTALSADDESPELEVSKVKLDDEIQRVAPSRIIRLVKIDVEGHEIEVLSGMIRSIEKRLIQHAVIEVSPGDIATKFQEILDNHSGSISRVRCWVDGQWITTKVSSLEHRTDVHVSFGS